MYVCVCVCVCKFSISVNVREKEGLKTRECAFADKKVDLGNRKQKERGE